MIRAMNRLKAIDEALRARGLRRHFRRGARLDEHAVALLSHAQRIAVIEAPLADDARAQAALRAQGVRLFRSDEPPENVAERIRWLIHTPVAEQHRHWMRRAVEQARAAGERGEVPVGAVLVRDARVLAEAGNAPIANHDPTAHAEILALRAAGASLANYRLAGCTLYVTLEPCAMCASAMAHARIATLVYGASDPRAGAVDSRLQLFGQIEPVSPIAVQSGVEAEACRELLDAFFAARRGV